MSLPFSSCTGVLRSVCCSSQTLVRYPQDLQILWRCFSKSPTTMTECFFDISIGGQRQGRIVFKANVLTQRRENKKKRQLSIQGESPKERSNRSKLANFLRGSPNLPQTVYSSQEWLRS